MVLSSRGVQVTVGGEVELVCRVRGPSLPVTVTWSLQRDGQSAPDNILTLSYTGDITWSGDQSNYQLRATTGKKEVRYYLRIIKASHKEAGRYQCVISAFLQGRHRKSQNSNALGVLVQTPGRSKATGQQVNLGLELGSQPPSCFLYFCFSLSPSSRECTHLVF